MRKFLDQLKSSTPSSIDDRKKHRDRKFCVSPLPSEKRRQFSVGEKRSLSHHSQEKLNPVEKKISEADNHCDRSKKCSQVDNESECSHKDDEKSNLLNSVLSADEGSGCHQKSNASKDRKPLPNDQDFSDESFTSEGSYFCPVSFDYVNLRDYIRSQKFNRALLPPEFNESDWLNHKSKRLVFSKSDRNPSFQLGSLILNKPTSYAQSCEAYDFMSSRNEIRSQSKNSKRFVVSGSESRNSSMVRSEEKINIENKIMHPPSYQINKSDTAVRDVDNSDVTKSAEIVESQSPHDIKNDGKLIESDRDSQSSPMNIFDVHELQGNSYFLIPSDMTKSLTYFDASSFKEYLVRKREASQRWRAAILYLVKKDFELICNSFQVDYCEQRLKNMIPQSKNIQ